MVQDATAAGDELSPTKKKRAISAVLGYMVFKVSMDCCTISVWPLLLKDLYGGNVALAAAAAATTSSLCGIGELLLTPAVGKLSDRFGRRAFFLIGPLVNVAVSLLQLRYQRSIAVAYVQRVLGQTFSTISGTTICSATLSDVASGHELSTALGSMASSIGLGVAGAPFVAGLLMRPFPLEMHATVGYALRMAISTAAAVFIAVRMPETLPQSKRRPFRLRDASPFGFLRLFLGSSSTPTLRRLCGAIGVGSLMEGKMTSDILMLTLRENVGWASAAINNYLASIGFLTFLAGTYSVRFLLKLLGPRRYTDVTLALSTAGHLLMGAVPKPWAVMTQMWLVAPGTQNLWGVALKSRATAHATSPVSNMGRGEFAAALSSTRALMMVIGPTLWGWAYTALLRGGRPPNWSWLGVAVLGAALPGLIHRSIRDADWAVPTVAIAVGSTAQPAKTEPK